MTVRKLGERPVKFALFPAVDDEDAREVLEGCTPKETKKATCVLCRSVG